MPATRPLALGLALALAALLAAPDAGAQKKKAAKPKAPPAPTACTDFHAVANAQWLQANPAPASGSVSALGQLVERSQQQQRDLLDAAMASPQGNVQKLLGDFWASGLDEAAVERDGAQPLAPLLSRIDAIRRAKDVAPAIAALHQVGIPVAFHFGADVDLKDLDRHIGYFSQGGLGLPDPAFYTRTDAPTRAVLARYNAYVQKILALAGTPQAQLAAQAQQVIDLETRIAQASRPLTALRDPVANHAPVATASLAKAYRSLQLAEFLKVQGVADDTVSIANPALFAQLDALAGGLKPDQWKAYLRFHVGNAMAPYLSKPWRDADFEFRGRVLRGEAAPAPRWQQVLAAINTAAGPMLGREYAARYLPSTTRSRAEAIAGDVRAALARAVQESTWMGPAAKAEAAAKLERLKVEVGTPRRDLDYTVQPMGRGSFGGNLLIASTWRHRQEMARIGKGNADRRWDVLPQEPALAYDLAHNRLVVTAAMLQAPVLDMGRDAAAQYGAFGALVGHELTHAVAGKGRVVDAAGNLRDWWTPAEATAWDVLSQKANAQPRLRESSVADLSGIELAWAAWRATSPSADKVASQSFYQGWASLWPEQANAATLAARAATATHPPGAVRTNDVVANQPGFGEAFGCKAGSAMQRKPEQQARVWR